MFLNFKVLKKLMINKMKVKKVIKVKMIKVKAKNIVHLEMLQYVINIIIYRIL